MAASRRWLSTSRCALREIAKESGLSLGNRFATLRSDYQAPRNPIILCHGLFGFSELHLAGAMLPGIKYWHGISDALKARGSHTIETSVPPAASIEERAEVLCDVIEREARGCSVNIIAHSMGGLDSRYLISRLRPTAFKVLSLTTIATPHRGSACADEVMSNALATRIARSHPRSSSGLHLPSMTALAQLTTQYMTQTFNPSVPDASDVRYFSYGAMFTPHWFSAFRLTHAILQRAAAAQAATTGTSSRSAEDAISANTGHESAESSDVDDGANDGLVTVRSARWGEYKGTLVGVDHLDLINWTNRLRWGMLDALGKGHEHNFNALALYLDIADMLAKEGF